MVVVLGLVPLSARRAAYQALSHPEDRFSDAARVPQSAARPVVRAASGGRVALHPFSTVTDSVLIGGKTMAQVRSELAGVLAARARLRGRAAVSASRRRVALFALSGVFVLLALAAFLSWVSWLWCWAPILGLVAVLGHGAWQGAQFNRELAQLDAKARELRAAPVRSPRMVKAEPVTVAVEVEAEEVAEDLPTESQIDAQPDATVKASVPESKPAKVQGWKPSEPIRPVYQMRALAPRRELSVARVETDPNGVVIPVRPVRARGPKTGALSSTEVAEQASLRFDVDTVIERRRAAS
ncbi:hypothetical protein [Boudabousia liubingyangii]|uniref:hypothetical protein n=1 Tax=Boudabousia liubingyangii TaxID=1921764 RepID=UPI0015D665C1|nr:hypothetical protein [Boudabousia liubingyangii]